MLLLAGKRNVSFRFPQYFMSAMLGVERMVTIAVWGKY